MCTLPKNLKEQEELFFKSGFKVNPVFEYDNFDFTQSYLNEFQFVEDQSLLKIAINIMESFLTDY
jgi:hypothetical protein